jgi:hypothetical protein
MSRSFPPPSGRGKVFLLTSPLIDQAITLTIPKPDASPDYLRQIEFIANNHIVPDESRITAMA